MDSHAVPRSRGPTGMGVAAWRIVRMARPKLFACWQGLQRLGWTRADLEKSHESEPNKGTRSRSPPGLAKHDRQPAVAGRAPLHAQLRKRVATDPPSPLLVGRKMNPSNLSRIHSSPRFPFGKLLRSITTKALS